jgi:RNA polymerase sigma-70 factor (ECF subfamily)
MAEQASADELLERWRGGDEAAATELYERYARRLYFLASGQMGERLRRRLAPDDIVQSAFRTFFRRADQWQFQQDKAGAIWHLLVRITLNKIRSKGIHHAAQKRDVGAEFALADDDFDPALVVHEPTPDEAAELADVIEVTIDSLDDKETRALELALQGFTASEIASQVGCSRWTVRRLLDRIGHRLLEQLKPDDSP